MNTEVNAQTYVPYHSNHFCRCKILSVICAKDNTCYFSPWNYHFILNQETNPRILQPQFKTPVWCMHQRVNETTVTNNISGQHNLRSDAAQNNQFNPLTATFGDLPACLSKWIKISFRFMWDVNHHVCLGLERQIKFCTFFSSPHFTILMTPD